MAGKWTGRLSGLFGKEPAQQKHEPLPEGSDADSEGQEYLDSIRGKLAMLAEDFAGGRVNRAQFEELYTHYQRERENVARLIVSRPLSDAWRIAVSDGESVMIRRRLAARVLGYAVYANKDQAALRVYGEFSSLASKWVSLLMDRVQSTHTEPYVVGTFETRSADAACLCTVPGEFTVLVVLFNQEPARVQTQLLEDLHRHFEQANYRILGRPHYKVGDLVFPYAAAFE